MANLKGKVEGVRGRHIEGWLRTAVAVDVTLHVDDRPVATAQTLDQSVAGLEPGVGRFRIPVPDALFDGRVHKIAVKAADEAGFINVVPLIVALPSGGGDSPVPPPSSAPPLRQQPAPAETTPRARSGVPVRMPDHLRGYCDGFRRSYLYGWIAGASDEDPVELELYVDNAPAGRYVADQFRQDVRDAGMGNGVCGFHIDLPLTFRDGQPHRLDLRLPGDPSSTLFMPVLASVASKKTPRPVAPRPEPPPVTAPAPQSVASAACRLNVERIMRGRARLVVRGWVARSDNTAITAPVELRLSGLAAPVKVARLDHRGYIERAGIAGGWACFAAVFALDGDAPLPAVLSARVEGEGGVTEAALDGVAVDLVTAAVRCDGDNGSEISGHCLDLDARDLPQAVTLRLSDTIGLELLLSQDGRMVFSGTAGPVAAHFATSVDALFREIYAVDANFAVTGDTLDIEVAAPDGRRLLKGSVTTATPVTFEIEQFTPNLIAGWMVNSVRSEGYAEMDVFIDGTRFATITGDRPRDDIVAEGLTVGGGGFRFSPHNPHDHEGDVEIRFAPRHSRDFIEDGPTRLRLLSPPRAPLRGVLAGLEQAQERGATVVVPVCDVGGDLKACLDALLEHTTLPARLIVIDDACSNPATRRLLETCRHPGVEVHRNDRPAGYAAALNLGVALAGDDDVVLVHPDTVVTPGWLQGLCAAAYHDPRVATATAVSNNAGAFSVPEPGAANRLPAGFAAADFARLIRQAEAGVYPHVASGSTFCMYVRRDALDRLGDFDAEAFPNGNGADVDFCLRAGRAGMVNVVDDRTLVYRERDMAAVESPALHERFPEYDHVTGAFGQGEGAHAMRWRVRRALGALAAETAALPRPRVCYVIATKTGGTPQTNRDLMGAITDGFEPWVLACDGSVVELFRYEGTGETLVEAITLSTPIAAALHRSADYNDQVARLLLKYGFELVHVRHLGWHGADLPKVAQTLGIPVIMSLHDFYTVCPTVKLLDEDKVFCGGHCTATAGDCAVELWRPSEFPPLKNHFIHRWREIFADTFRYCDAFVTTSERARDIFTATYDALEEGDFRLIPHGRTFTETGRHAVRPSAGAPLRVLVPGNISPAKGADLINAVIDLDDGGLIEFHLLGDPGQVRRDRGTVMHGAYRRDEFAGKVAAIAPHIGVALSIWPETYCHTLTEMWASGVPVLGLDSGAVGERIEAHGGGWLLARDADPEMILARLVTLGGEEWDEANAEVAVWQETYNAGYGVREMAAAYQALYADVLRRQRVLLNGPVDD